MEAKANFVHRLHVLPWTYRTPKAFSCHNRICCAIKIVPFRDIITTSPNRSKRIDAVNNDGFQCLQQSLIASSDIPQFEFPGLSFDRLQLSDNECGTGPKRTFGRYVARGTTLDEEFWTAAWLRAESHWETAPHSRHVDIHKRNFAEQEFYSLKQRCAIRPGSIFKCHCVVAVKKEARKVRRTLLNSIVGTLDICVQSFSQGETIPGLRRPAGFATDGVCCFGSYAYVANLCVAKYARRQGIGTNMMYLASDFATLSGIKKIFIHVNADNKPAQELYQKIGFQMVEEASASMAMDGRILMCLNI